MLGRHSAFLLDAARWLTGKLSRCIFNLRFMVILRILRFKFLMQNTLAEPPLTVLINPSVCISINTFQTQLETLELHD